MLLLVSMVQLSANAAGERRAGVDVSVTRVTHGARTVAPGDSVLLSVTVLNRGDTATSAQAPLVLRFRDLPSGVMVRPGDAGQPGLTCAPDACTYTAPVSPQQVTAIPLVATVARSVAVGTPVRFAIEGDTTADVDDTYASGPVRFQVTGRSDAAVRVDVRAISDLTVGRPATLHARLLNVAGRTVRSVRVRDVIDRGLLRDGSRQGPGWACGSDCRFRGKLPVGTSSAPLTIRGVVRDGVTARSLSRGSRVTGRLGTVRWHSQVRSDGSGTADTQSHTLTVRTTPPRPAVAERSDDAAPNWTRLAHLEAAMTAQTVARPGGLARFQVQALHNGVDHTRGPVRAGVTLPHGLTVRDLKGPAWRCPGAIGRRVLNCRLDRPVRAGAAAPRLALVARVAPTVGRHLAPTRLAVRWRAADGPHRDTDRDQIRVVPRLRVDARVSDRTVMAPARQTPGAPGKTVMLQARIRGTDERVRPAHRWSQIAGPRVRWVDPRRHDHGHARVTTRFLVPRVKKVTTVAFRVAATAHGAQATDTVRIRVKPRRVARLDPGSTAPRVRAPGRIPDRSAWSGKRVRSAIRMSIGGRGATRVRAGEHFRLRAQVAGKPGLRHRWRVVDGPGRILRGDRSGTAVSLRAPRRPGLFTVGLRSVDARGRHVHRAEVIRVLPRRGVTSASVTAAADATGFCELFAQAAGGNLRTGIPVAGASATLTPGAVTASTGACSAPGAAISFTGASLVVGQHTFSGMTGSLDATGLSLESGTFDLPSSWTQALSYLDEPSPSLTFATPGGSAITAPWSGSGLGDLGGSLTVSEFLFLDLPTGWTGSTTFTFTPQATDPFAIDASAADSSGSDKSGSVELTGSVGADGTFSVTVAVANIAIFPAGDGSQATVDGSGTITLATPGGSVSYSLQASLSGAIDLFPEFTLRTATLDWDHTGVSVSGTGILTAGQQQVPLAVAGTYAGADNWSLDVTQKGPWAGSDVTVTDLAGDLSYSGQTLGFTVSGDASGLDLPNSITASSVSAEVTNQCPSGQSGCTPGNIRLSLDVTGTIVIAGDTDDYSGSVDVDLDTMDFSFEATINGSFGPDGLPLTEVTVQVDDGPATSGTCAPSSGKATGEKTTFTAQVDDVFGDDNIAVVGEINDLGYCFSADLAQFSPTGEGTTDSAFGGVALIYSSYDTTVSVPGESTPVTVSAGTAGLFGTFTAPQSMSDGLGGLAGTGTFSAVLTDGSGGLGFTGTIDYTFDAPLYLMGSAAEPGSDSLTLTDVSLTVDMSASEIEIDLSADGDYSADQSVMPLTVGVDVDLTGASFGFSASAAGGNPVRNAFGYPGLLVDNLAISGSVGLTDSFGFAADVDLPTSWDGSLGVQPDTPLSLVIDISTTPCFQFSIGQASQTVEAVDFMNAGVLVADYANLVLAPAGCQFADVNLPPGFAFDFDGELAGDQVDFNSALSLGGAGFALTADLYVAEFRLGSTTTLQDNSLSLRLDPSQDVFEIGMSSTISSGGDTLAISGSYDRAGPGSVTASFNAQSQGQVSFAGFDFDDADVDLQYSSTPTASSLSFTMSGSVTFLDQSVAGTVALTMQNGSVTSAAGQVDVFADFGVASVQGPLSFAYRSGQGASVDFGPGTISAFGVTFDQVTGSLEPDGSYAVQATTAIPYQNASAADAWLYGNEGGEFNTTFYGQLQINVTGGDGQSATVGYQGSWVVVTSQWAEHSWDSYGDFVTVPSAGDGCAPPTVTGDGWVGNPAVNFELNPVAVERASTGDTDDDDNYCIPFTSNIF